MTGRKHPGALVMRRNQYSRASEDSQKGRRARRCRSVRLAGCSLALLIAAGCAGRSNPTAIPVEPPLLSTSSVSHYPKASSFHVGSQADPPLAEVPAVGPIAPSPIQVVSANVVEDSVPVGVAADQFPAASPLDSFVSLIPARDSRQIPCFFPAVLYERSTLALAVPDETAPASRSSGYRSGTVRTWVKAVVLRKEQEPNQGELRQAYVSAGHALFRDLAAGNYAVYYLATPIRLTEDRRPERPEDLKQLSTPPYRRIVIAPASGPLGSTARSVPSTRDARQEMIRQAAATENARRAGQDSRVKTLLGWWRETGPTSTEVATPSGLPAQRSARGWQLLGKRSHFAALREFRLAVRAIAEKENGRATAYRQSLTGPGMVPRLLEDPEDAVSAMLHGQANARVQAQDLVRYLGQRPDAALTVYGLGKTYEAIGQEPVTLIAGADYLAIICYLAAEALDSDLLEATNDLGVVYYRLGWPDQAREQVLRAAESREHSRFAYNAGRLLAEQGQARQAREWWERAVALDPDFVPVLFELSTQQVSSSDQVLTTEQCCALANTLRQISEQSERGSPECRWANQVLDHLQLLGHELRVNSPSFVLRHSLPVPPERWTALTIEEWSEKYAASQKRLKSVRSKTPEPVDTDRVAATSPRVSVSRKPSSEDSGNSGLSGWAQFPGGIPIPRALPHRETAGRGGNSFRESGALR